MAEMSGGLRSMAILQALDRGRFRAVAAARASRTIGGLQWRPAQAGSVQLDPQRTTWHSGCVKAVLSDGHAIVAGAQTGGVWLINPSPAPSFRDGYRATPLSDGWDNPNVESLAYGPDGYRHVFVGCREADNLLLIELQTVPGAVVARRSDLAIPLPDRSTVHAIAVLDNPRRIVLGVSRGVLWADVPPSPSDVDAYVWQEAGGLPPGVCGAVIRGPGTSLAAAASAAGAPSRLGVERPSNAPSQLFTGDWQDGALLFAPAAVPAVAMGVYNFVLASCADAPQRMYGAARDGAGQVACVLRSDDGGRSWAEIAVPPGAGGQGERNRALAVSPYRPDVVALGWQARGPFLSVTGGDSVDGGAGWTFLSGGDGTDANGQRCPGSPLGLHSDVQDLYFPRNPSGTDQLVVASDGGVAVTSDLGRCIDSQYNRGLAALQMYGPEHYPKSTLTVSSRFPGVLAVGTQDNGNLVLYPDSDAGAVWHQLVGGDGSINRFVDAIEVLLHTNSDVLAVRMTRWDAARTGVGAPGSLVPTDRDAERIVPKGLSPNCLESVLEPNWGRSGQRLYACAGSTNGDVHGLFADAGGENALFVRLANVGKGVAAVASLSGAEVLVGCSDGRIVAADSATGTWSEQPQDNADFTGGIVRIEVLARDFAYALRRGDLLRYDGRSWSVVSTGRDWQIFTVDRFSGRIFAATDADVFSSADGGKTWNDASVGLPARPHCTDLRIGSDADGGSSLYLATYGRSAWRARITTGPDEGPDFDLPPQAREILLGVIQDGGGIVRVGGRIVRIPPRQPVKDVFAALATAETARGMSPEAAREIQRTVLQELVRVVRLALERLG